MALKNIILFTGTQRALAQAELARWESVFANKHGAYNISRFSRSDTTSLASLVGEIMAPAFGFCARLIVVEGFLSARPEHLSATEDKGIIALQAQVLTALKTCPETNFVVFWDGEIESNDLSDWIKTNANIKRFDAMDASQSAQWIADKLPGGDLIAARTLLTLRGGNLEAAARDAFRLSLFQPDGTITERDVREYCPALAGLAEPYGLSNALESLDGRRAMAELALQAKESDPLMILASCIGMLRRTVWVLRMLAAGKTATTISKACGVSDKKLAMVSKRLQYASRLENLYSRLVDLDWRAKSGRVPGGASEGTLACLCKIFADLIPAAPGTANFSFSYA